MVPLSKLYVCTRLDNYLAMRTITYRSEYSRERGRKRISCISLLLSRRESDEIGSSGSGSHLASPPPLSLSLLLAPRGIRNCSHSVNSAEAVARSLPFTLSGERRLVCSVDRQSRLRLSAAVNLSPEVHARARQWHTPSPTSSAFVFLIVHVRLGPESGETCSLPPSSLSPPLSYTLRYTCISICIDVYVNSRAGGSIFPAVRVGAPGGRLPLHRFRVYIYIDTRARAHTPSRGYFVIKVFQKISVKSTLCISLYIYVSRVFYVHTRVQVYDRATTAAAAARVSCIFQSPWIDARPTACARSV